MREKLMLSTNDPAGSPGGGSPMLRITPLWLTAASPVVTTNSGGLDVGEIATLEKPQERFTKG